MICAEMSLVTGTRWNFALNILRTSQKISIAVNLPPFPLHKIVRRLSRSPRGATPNMVTGTRLELCLEHLENISKNINRSKLATVPLA